MPRNTQGVYSLPAGNPVIPGTLIETTWANPTMSDIAAALTGSLPRNGSAPMTRPLILAGDATVPLEAVPLQQLSSMIGSTNSFLPAGAIQLFAMTSVPTGWLECDGSAVSRTTYANLFSAIGTLYGAGNGTTTFNLPDLRGMFVRGFDNGRSLDPGRTMGSQQAAANNPHTHAAAVVNPAHTHGITDPGHGHAVVDPGHTHNYYKGGVVAGSQYVAGVGWINNYEASGSAQTGVTISPSSSGVSAQNSSQATTVTNASEGTEARPINVAMVYAIKAFGALQTDGLGSMAFQNKESVDITGGSGVFTTLQCTTAPVNSNDVARLADIGGSIANVYSSDPAVLLVDTTTPSAPVLRPQVNVPNGMVKLDAAGYVPSSVLNVTDLTFLGMWDANPGLLPSGTFATGDYYQIDTAGTLLLHTSGGTTATPCNIGDSIIYDAVTPGWWYAPAAVASALPASAVTFTPDGTIGATNVQDAVMELEAETIAALSTKVAKAGDVMTGPLTATVLTSNGQIESKATGFKFPDATFQTSAALTAYIGGNQSLATNGYQKLPGGLILQWGQLTNDNIQGNGLSAAFFPIAFPTAVLHVSVEANAASLANGAGMNTARIPFGSGTLDYAIVAWYGANNALTTEQLAGQWFAIGY